jgi:hypothetical protein
MRGFFMGLIVGEGSFSIPITAKSDCNHGVQAKPKFCINMHKENEHVLKYLRDSTELGRLSKTERFTEWTINDLDSCIELSRWIDSEFGGTIFDETAKAHSFQKWVKCLDILNSASGQSAETIKQIAEIRDDMNMDSRGRTKDEIVEHFNLD